MLTHTARFFQYGISPIKSHTAIQIIKLANADSIAFDIILLIFFESILCFIYYFILFECKSSHIIKYDKGKWGMSVNLCRFAKNRIQDIEI